MAEPRRPHRERHRERHRRVLLPGEPAGDVDVGRGEHAGVVERAQQAGRGAGEPDVEAVLGDHAPPSSTSLSAVTSAAGGFHANTPHGVPSTTGVSAPRMPRTNR